MWLDRPVLLGLAEDDSPLILGSDSFAAPLLEDELDRLAIGRPHGRTESVATAERKLIVAGVYQV